MEKQTQVTLSLDAIEQRLKGVLASAFSDGMVTRTGGHQLLNRIMCSLKGDDPESLTFAELTSYMPAPECVILAQTPAPGSIKALLEAMTDIRATLLKEADSRYIPTLGDLASMLDKADAALAPFKGTQEVKT